jgi:arginine decarboxylase
MLRILGFKEEPFGAQDGKQVVEKPRLEPEEELAETKI